METIYQRRTGGPQLVVLKWDETHVTLRNVDATRFPHSVLPRRTFEEDFALVQTEGTMTCRADSVPTPDVCADADDEDDLDD